MSNESETHELPLTHRLVAGIIRDWLDTAHGIATYTVNPDFSDYERGKHQGFEEMRYLHLDNYYYTVTPKIIDALKRAGRVNGGES